VPGYSLIVEPLGATTRTLIGTARANEIPISIDASSTGAVDEFGVDAFKAQLTELEPDILFCNRDEAQMIEVGPNSGLEGVQLAVVKAGADPVVLVDQHGNSTEIPVPAVAAVADTTGAGDAFAAGFIVATMEGADPAEAAHAANRLAATVLLRPGAGTNRTSRSS
jgi:sugar/nucleoside kinase (ribokinase family)